jgi:predicted TIM-barrel fold metal-dependent hydrolase
MIRPEYELYIQHALTLNDVEVQMRDELMPQLPDTIIDSHTHAAVPGEFDHETLPEHVHRHMMSTFPTFGISDSDQASELLFPGKVVAKARFAHAFAGIDKREVNDFLATETKPEDYAILFGVSETAEDVEYTIAQIETGIYKGLKMYYFASDPPKYGLYEYFPRPILDAAQKAGIPIILHLPHSLYRSENEVEQLSQEYPDLRIILAHVGVANLPQPELDPILRHFAQLPNVYVDTALVDADGIAVKALQHLGPQRVLYGSDEPLNLLRTVTYFNPELHTARVLTDFPYHWADPIEQTKYRSAAEKEFIHNHWLQLTTLLDGIVATSNSPAERQTATEMVFRTNAEKLFGIK